MPKSSLTSAGAAGERGNAARLFGYDIFISFALSAPPRGSRSYASDLARRLRERDYTVFFSEEEAPAGGQLDDALKQALKRSRILVVIANRGTLADPRWVRVEVEEFRRLHPDRPVIPISIGGALQDPALGPATESWLQFGNKIWIDDIQQAADEGIVSEETLERLATAPTALRASRRWRWTVRAAFAVLSALTIVALWFAWSDRQNAKLAREQRTQAERNAELASKNEQQALENEASARRESQRAVKAEGEALREADAARAAERHALSGRLAAESQLARSSDTRLALLLAREAWSADRTQEARRALYESLHEPVPLVLASGLGALRHFTTSADDRFIATSSNDQIHLWRIQGNRLIPTLLKAQSRVSAIAFSPDSRLLAWLDADARLQLWNTERAAPVGAPIIDAALEQGWSIAWHPRGRIIAVAGQTDQGHSVKLWDIVERRQIGEPLHQSNWRGGELHVAFSPRGERLAANLANGINVWDLKTRQLVVPPFNANIITHFIAFRDEDRMVLPGPDYEATAWRLGGYPVTATKTATYGGHSNWVGAFAHSSAGNIAATGSNDYTIRLWTADSAEALRDPLLLHHADITGLAFNSAGTKLYSAADDGRMIRWLLNTGSHRFRKAETEKINLANADLTLNEDVRWAVLLLREADRLEWRDIASGRVQHAAEVREGDEGLAVARDGTLALRRFPDLLRLHALGQGQARCAIDKPAGRAMFSPDARWLVTSNSDDPFLRIWQASNCRAFAAIARSGERAAFRPFVFSADARKLWIANEGSVRAYDVAKRRYDPGPGYPAPNTTTLAADPRGRFLASGDEDGAVRLIDLQGGLRTAVLSGPDRRLQTGALAFSADGLWLAGGTGGQLWLWDLEAGQAAGTPIATGQGKLHRVGFSTDSRVLITLGTDGPPAIWHVDADVWADRACQAAQRNLSCTEWRRVMGSADPYRKSCPLWPAGVGAERCVGK